MGWNSIENFDILRICLMNLIILSGLLLIEMSDRVFNNPLCMCVLVRDRVGQLSRTDVNNYIDWWADIGERHSQWTCETCCDSIWHDSDKRSALLEAQNSTDSSSVGPRGFRQSVANTSYSTPDPDVRIQKRAIPSKGPYTRTTRR